MPKEVNPKEFSSVLAKMKNFLKIYKIDSCMLIIFYLVIYGKITPQKIKQLTDLSSSTLFRNLSLLHEVKFIAKEEDISIEDKRYRTHYFIDKALSIQNEIPMSKEFMRYLMSDHFEFYKDWYSTVSNLSGTLARYAAELNSKQRFTVPQEHQEDTRNGDIQFLTFFEEDLHKDLIEKIRTLVKEIMMEKRNENNITQYGLKDPIIMYLNLLRLKKE